MFNLNLRNVADNQFEIKVKWSENSALTSGTYSLEQFDAIVNLISKSMKSEDRSYYKTEIELHFAKSMFANEDDRELGMRLDINADEATLGDALDRRLNFWLQMPLTEVEDFKRNQPDYIAMTERLINAWMVARTCYRKQLGLDEAA